MVQSGYLTHFKYILYIEIYIEHIMSVRSVYTLIQHVKLQT